MDSHKAINIKNNKHSLDMLNNFTKYFKPQQNKVKHPLILKTPNFHQQIFSMQRAKLDQRNDQIKKVIGKFERDQPRIYPKMNYFSFDKPKKKFIQKRHQLNY